MAENEDMKAKDLLKLIISVIVSESAGYFGAIFTAPAISTWYPSLHKLDIVPNWLFAPVWIILYLLIGVSFFIVWKRNFTIANALGLFGGKPRNKWSDKFWNGSWQKANIILIFAVQYILNVLWSYIFFGMHQTGVAFFEILTLWTAALYMLINFYRVSKTAAWLLAPYILWLSFAAVLNYLIFIMNL